MKKVLAAIGRFFKFVNAEIDRSNNPVGLRVEGKDFREIFPSHRNRVRPQSTRQKRKVADLQVERRQRKMSPIGS